MKTDIRAQVHEPLFLVTRMKFVGFCFIFYTTGSESTRTYDLLFIRLSKDQVAKNKTFNTKLNYISYFTIGSESTMTYDHLLVRLSKSKLQKNKNIQCKVKFKEEEKTTNFERI